MDFPLSRSYQVSETVISTGTRWGGWGPQTLNTKCPWYEIVSSTPYDCHGIVVSPRRMSTNNSTTEPADILIDIAIGPDGSEELLVADIGLQDAGTYIDAHMFSMHIPIHLAKGTRISARWQTNRLAVGSPSAWSMDFAVAFLRGSSASWFSLSETIGGTHSRSGGTAIYIPAANSWSPSYTELSATGFQRDVKAFIPRWQGQSPSDYTFGSAWGFQLCLGAQGKEVPIWQSPTIFNIFALGSVCFYSSSRVQDPIPISIPKGVRVTARGWKNGTGMGNYRDLMIIGFS